MNDPCIVIHNDLLQPRYIAEDDIPRNGGRWPEYANTMMICIDSFEDGLAQGRLHSFYFRESTSFRSLDQLLFGLEQIMDRAEIPQAAMEMRRAKKKPSKKKKPDAPMEEPTKCYKDSPYYSLENLTAEKGIVANFYIRVYQRLNASMQGVLVSAGDTEQHCFRSELELLYLLRDYLNLACEKRSQNDKSDRLAIPEQPTAEGLII